MRSHFTLQYQLISRHLRELGLSVWTGCALFLLMFLVFSAVFFYKLESAEWVYPIFSLTFLSIVRDSARSEFFAKIYQKEILQKIRTVEHLLVLVLPVLFLVFKGFIIQGSTLLVVAAGFSFMPDMRGWGRTVPTPFGRIPFEFPAGFRLIFPLLILCWIVLVIAIRVDNFNLGLFASLVPVLIAANFYAKPEPIYYITIFAKNRRQFLHHKVKEALLGGLILGLPCFLGLLPFYLQKWPLVLGAVAFGLAFIVVAMLGKYAVYPARLNVIQGLAVGFCLLFPPLILFVLPWFYQKAMKHLKSLLK